MEKKNILVFPAGSENAINIYDSLKYNLHFELFGASSKKDYGEILYPENHYCISELYITDIDFISKFNKIVEKFQIDFIIPTHDTIALFLMENEEKIKAQIICSPLETARIANSKIEIFRQLEGKKYAPKIFHNINEVFEYPVFVKPNIGAGGKGTYLAKNKIELEKILTENKDVVISEFLPGEELTVDCFTDSKGELLFIGPRTRERITMGISFSSKAVNLNEEIRIIAHDLNQKFKFRGAWFFQVKKDKNGKYKIMEFSVRQAGTMALYRMLGINFSSLSIFDRMGLDVETMFINYPIKLERRLKNSYQLNYSYDKVYIDYDDTIIVNGKINTDIMKFIYQCNNKKKKVCLITKHDTDIYNDLKKFHIAPTLFEQIISLKKDEHKTDYIKPQNAVFIDNYYLERKEVFNKYHIPVFDVDGVDCLIDYSE